MYLFTRRARIRTGSPHDATAWAGSITETAKQVSGLDISLFAGVLGPEVGTLVWSSVVPDLVALEAATDKLAVDGGYADLIVAGQAFVPDGADDRLLQFVFPDAATMAAGAGAGEAPAFTYASVLSSICADGAVAQGIGLGVELAQAVTEITGAPTSFLVDTTGPYGGVNWISTYADIAAFEAANAALAANEAWVARVDRDVVGVYNADPSATQQLLYRRIL